MEKKDTPPHICTNKYCPFLFPEVSFQNNNNPDLTAAPFNETRMALLKSDTERHLGEKGEWEGT